MMKPKPKSAIRELRKLLGQTQSDFAALVGASKDAVASWEIGRNPVSASQARRISHATGVHEQSLRSNGPLWMALAVPRKAYTLEDYHRHRKVYWGNSDQHSAERQLGPCRDALELIFRAAALAGAAGKTLPLPGVRDAFVQWCRETVEAFGLERQIDAQLEQRRSVTPITRTRREWREMARKQPAAAAQAGFVDDPQKDDQERVVLKVATFPVWAPGWDMRRGKK